VSRRTRATYRRRRANACPSADGIRLHLEITAILDGQPGSVNQAVQSSFGHQQDVIHDLLRRAHIAVAVVPRELGQLQ
jgi:hypothetical protein